MSGEDVENEAVFILEGSWLGDHRTKVWLGEEEIHIENPSKKYCLWNQGPLKIPYHDILAVDIGFGSEDHNHLELDLRPKKYYKVFDSAFNIPVCKKIRPYYFRMIFFNELLNFSSALYIFVL